MFTKFKHILAINFLCSLGTLNYQLFVINPHLKQLSIENKQLMKELNYQVFVINPQLKQLSVENKQLSLEFTDLRKVISKYHK